MHICIYVCAYICVHLSMYIHIYACMYIKICDLFAVTASYYVNFLNVVGENCLRKEPDVVYNRANNLESHGVCDRSRMSGESKEAERLCICPLQ